MDIAQMVLEYLKVLVWPLLAGLALLLLWRPIYTFLEGLDELTFSNVGVRRRNDSRAVAVEREAESLAVGPDVPDVSGEAVDEVPRERPAIDLARLAELQRKLPSLMHYARVKARNSWEVTRFSGEALRNTVVGVAQALGRNDWDHDIEFGWGAVLRRIGAPDPIVSVAKELYAIYVDVTIEGNVRQIGDEGAESFSKTAEVIAGQLLHWAMQLPQAESGITDPLP